MKCPDASKSIPLVGCSLSMGFTSPTLPLGYAIGGIGGSINNAAGTGGGNEGGGRTDYNCGCLSCGCKAQLALGTDDKYNVCTDEEWKNNCRACMCKLPFPECSKLGDGKEKCCAGEDGGGGVGEGGGTIGTIPGGGCPGCGGGMGGNDLGGFGPGTYMPPGSIGNGSGIWFILMRSRGGMSSYWQTTADRPINSRHNSNNPGTGLWGWDRVDYCCCTCSAPVPSYANFKSCTVQDCAVMKQAITDMEDCYNTGNWAVNVGGGLAITIFLPGLIGSVIGTIWGIGSWRGIVADCERTWRDFHRISTDCWNCFKECMYNTYGTSLVDEGLIESISTILASLGSLVPGWGILIGGGLGIAGGKMPTNPYEDMHPKAPLPTPKPVPSSPGSPIPYRPPRYN